MGVVRAHRVVGAGLAGGEVEPVQLLAEGGDVLVDDDPQILQRGPLRLDPPSAVAAGDRVGAAASDGHQHPEPDRRTGVEAAAAGAAPGGGGLAVGRPCGRVDEAVQALVDRGVVGTLDRSDEVLHRVARHHPRVGAGVEAVAELDGVDAADADLGAQVLEQGAGLVLGGPRQHRDEDRLVRVLDFLGQRVRLGTGELVRGTGIDVDRALFEGRRGLVQPPAARAPGAIAAATASSAATSRRTGPISARRVAVFMCSTLPEPHFQDITGAWINSVPSGGFSLPSRGLSRRNCPSR